MFEQTIRFASVNGRRVAWAAVGEGPPLVMGGWWMSHLELDWRNPAFRNFIETLAPHRTIVRYDRPGTGLSAADEPPPIDLDAEVEVLAGVIDEVGTEPVDVVAASSGGPVVACYAAAAPERVRRLVLYGSYAKGSEITDTAARESLLGLVRRHWGVGSRVFADVFMPSASADEREAFAAFQRESSTADVAMLSLHAVYTFDATECLGKVTAPVTVLHRRGDRSIPFRLGQDLAARIPDSTFRALDGADHLPWHGQTEQLTAAILEGLGVEVPAAQAEVVAEAPAPAAERSVESDLSKRELEVLRLVALGLSDREIAERLVLSPHTVHRHVANVRTKLRQGSRAAAVAYAARTGLI